MKHYIGLDISKKDTAICMVDQTGNIIKETVAQTDPESIQKAILSFGSLEVEVIGLESGSWSHWLSEELVARDLPVICCDARKMAAFLNLRVNKTDRNDARGIAECLRCNFFSQVQIKSKDSLALGTLVRSRQQLVKSRIEIQGTIRGLLKPFGVKLACHSGRAFIQVVKEHLKQIPKLAKAALVVMLKSYATLLAASDKLEKELVAQAHPKSPIRKLLTIPGVGIITATAFVAEVGDPGRFRRSRQVGAYIGMTPRQYSSGETERQGRISKQGSPLLRSLLTEAGLVLLTRVKAWSKVRAWGMRVQKKHGTRKAAVAVGRKLAAVMHRMMITGEEFCYADEKVAQAA